MRVAGLTRWQWTTIASLTVGYMGYYFCRSNLSVAGPLLLDAYGDEGFTKESFGMIATVGVGFYTVGKLFNGVICDFVGGRRMFLIGMAGAILCTFAFSVGTGYTFFVSVWAVNRLVQSAGWGGLVKTAAHWFPSSMVGTVLGLLCLSYLFGDVIARLFLGQLIEWGADWRQVFWAAGGIVTVILILELIFLRPNPEAVGEESPVAHPENLFGHDGNASRPASVIALLTPFFRSVSFWLICLISFGLTLIRETFNFWTPTYLNEVAQLSPGRAALASSLFPFFGGISVVLIGLLSDRLTDGRRGLMMVVFLIPAVAVLFLLSLQDETSSATLQVTLISLTGLLILGPYALLTGALSVDLGGKQGSATAAGMADTAGYVGGMVSGWGIGTIATRWGWSGAFAFLACVLAVTTVLTTIYWYVHDVRSSASRDAVSDASGRA